ncbi:MAG TPA: zinc-binding alcohol dehydrogenase family protein [Solirubrobacteraceae bacterium]|nr:zinc-binding alcohol dehydrogenase family protein [Solirubrobacteraceae bacterium]
MLAATFREYGGPEVMRWERLDDPALAPDEVIVEVHACGLNHSDLDSRAGVSRWPFRFPHVLGAEFAGVVVAAGADVRGHAVGDPGRWPAAPRRSRPFGRRRRSSAAASTRTARGCSIAG